MVETNACPVSWFVTMERAFRTIPSKVECFIKYCTNNQCMTSAGVITIRTNEHDARTQENCNIFKKIVSRRLIKSNFLCKYN
jgi:hypothetical protein